MRKQAGKQLSLNRETVRELGSELSAARGGFLSLFKCRETRTCPSGESETPGACESFIVGACGPINK